MNKIKTALAAGLLAYVLVALWQAFENTYLLLQAAGLILILCIIAAALKMKNENTLKTSEMTAIWGCIGLFAAYAVLKVTGVL